MSPADIAVRQAQPAEADAVVAILREAAAWLAGRGIPLWKQSELAAAEVTRDVEAGRFFVAVAGTELVGTIRYQDDDPLFWPDATPGEAAYVHRIAIRRAHAGGGVSQALVEWAAGRARREGRRFLRLDTESSRPALRALYERLGFRHHSDRQVGPYHVARYELALRRDA